jgi:DNA-binding transcriptional MerR regulator
MEEELTIQEVAARTGLTVHTLRYYEQIGLLEPVNRATSGHRRYTTSDLEWIAFLRCLRATGMSIRQMQTFAELRRQGDAVVPERMAFLEAHQQQVLQRIYELEGYLTVIERKIQRHKNMLAGERNDITHNQALPHFSITESIPLS